MAGVEAGLLAGMQVILSWLESIGGQISPGGDGGRRRSKSSRGDSCTYNIERVPARRVGVATLAEEKEPSKGRKHSSVMEIMAFKISPKFVPWMWWDTN